MEEDIMEEQKMKDLREKFRLFKLEEIMNRAKEYKEQGKNKEEIKLLPNMNYLNDEELDEIFNEKIEEDSGVEEETDNGKIIFLKDEDLIDYENQPFSTNNEEDNQNLINSIRINGIIEPIVVRPYNGKYQILSGHRRRKCAREIGLTQLPCYVLEKDDNEAKIYLVDTNLVSRKNIKPTERAKAYLLKQEALKAKKLQSEEDNFNFRDAMENGNNASRTSIQRYLRINYLNKELQDAVDEKRINLNMAEQLSFLKKDEQELIAKMMNEENRKFTEGQIKKIRQMANDEMMNRENIENLLKSQVKDCKIVVSFTGEQMKKYFNDERDYNKIRKIIYDKLENAENSIVEF